MVNPLTRHCCFKKWDPATELQHFHELVARLNNHIRGTKATISELWYVEEYDLLALALDGKMKIHRFHMECSKA